ncbi:MAG TPA: UDP-3-O-(3-hydroxymyristoyl)glucosamine N-acyltransferase [Candidatus Competibacteraceae bacterium]|nr:UDP-3-O-(3-hydroxymyristoyl)glucosamine N-acyltransferase [Candidatus Competibacteraceae bacterium]
MTLAEIAAAGGAELRGDGSIEVSGVAPLHTAQPGQISFLANPRYRKYLQTTQAAAVVLSAEDAEGCPLPVLVAANPQLVFARIATLFAPKPPAQRGIHPSAVVSPQAQVAESAWIGPHCTVEAGAQIAEGVYIGPGCVVAENVIIGRDTRLVANITLCHGVVLGERVLVHPGAVIGSDGFGLANDGGRWVKIPQLGSVRIGDDVEIGANTTIDRGALDDTVLEEGVKLDNQIQVAHNVHIGAHTAIAGCTGIAGSVKIGRHCTLGGGVGLAGHLELADNVHITGMSLVTKSIHEPGVYSSGLAVEPSRRWNKISARLRRLDELFRRLTALEQRASQEDSTAKQED